MKNSFSIKTLRMGDVQTELGKITYFIIMIPLKLPYHPFYTYFIIFLSPQPRPLTFDYFAVSFSYTHFFFYYAFLLVWKFLFWASRLLFYQNKQGMRFQIFYYHKKKSLLFLNMVGLETTRVGSRWMNKERWVCESASLLAKDRSNPTTPLLDLPQLCTHSLFFCFSAVCVCVCVLFWVLPFFWFLSLSQFFSPFPSSFLLFLFYVQNPLLIPLSFSS